MAHLWIHDDDGAWTPVPLPASVPALDLRAAGGDWVLLGDAGTRVNGTPLVAGLCVLRDRDELLAGGRRVYFSTEMPAGIAPFAGPAAVTCPRCRLDIEPGTPAVVCPGCRVVHHQHDELPCFTHAARCAVCDHPSALDAGYGSSPEGL